MTDTPKLLDDQALDHLTGAGPHKKFLATKTFEPLAIEEAISDKAPLSEWMSASFDQTLAHKNCELIAADFDTEVAVVRTLASG